MRPSSLPPLIVRTVSQGLGVGRRQTSRHRGRHRRSGGHMSLLSIPTHRSGVERMLSPLGAVARGVAAGAAGVVAMDGFWYVRHLVGGGRTAPLTFEFGAERDWDQVSAPGKVGKRLIEGFTQEELPADKAPLVNDAVHWTYGMTWGAVYGLLVGSLRTPRSLLGLPFGAAVWMAGYSFLPLAKLSKPIWEYDPKTLTPELAAHLFYGLGTGVAFQLLIGIGRGRNTG